MMQGWDPRTSLVFEERYVIKAEKTEICFHEKHSCIYINIIYNIYVFIDICFCWHHGLRSDNFGNSIWHLSAKRFGKDLDSSTVCMWKKKLALYLSVALTAAFLTMNLPCLNIILWRMLDILEWLKHARVIRMKYRPCLRNKVKLSYYNLNDDQLAWLVIDMLDMTCEFIVMYFGVIKLCVDNKFPAGKIEFTVNLLCKQSVLLSWVDIYCS